MGTLKDGNLFPNPIEFAVDSITNIGIKQVSTSFSRVMADRMSFAEYRVISNRTARPASFDTGQDLEALWMCSYSFFNQLNDLLKVWMKSKTHIIINLINLVEYYRDLT